MTKQGDSFLCSCVTIELTVKEERVCVVFEMASTSSDAFALTIQVYWATSWREIFGPMLSKQFNMKLADNNLICTFPTTSTYSNVSFLCFSQLSLFAGYLIQQQQELLNSLLLSLSLSLLKTIFVNCYWNVSLLY